MEKDLGALQWVADELGQVSEQLVRSLLGFADDPAHASRLAACLADAHQIHATLRLLAVPSAEVLAGEIEQTLLAMSSAELNPSSNVLQTLLAAVMELPPYLRRVGSERRESPRDVLAVLNDLRALRGEQPLPPPPIELGFAHEALLLETGTGAPRASPDEVQLLRVVRQRFQTELIGVLRNEATEQRLAQLARVFALLGQRLGSKGHRLFWETASAWTDGLKHGGLALDSRAHALLRELDGELRAAVALEVDCYTRAPEPGLCTRLLESLATSAPVSESVVEMQRRHRLLGAPVMRHDMGATGAAIAALSEELGGALQRLELTEGDALASARTLQELQPELGRAAQLLVGLGFHEEFALLQTQIERIGAGFSAGSSLEEELTSISVALLDLDQRLAKRAIAAGGGGVALALRRHPLQRALEAVCREVEDALGRVKQTVADYLSSYGGLAVLMQLPEELQRLAGVLQLAGLDAAADVLHGCREHLVVVLAGERAAPNARVIDTLADALGAVEYFLERFVIDGYAANLILARAVDAVRGLAAPLAEPPPEPDTQAILDELAEGILLDSDADQGAPQPAAPAPVASSQAKSGAPAGVEVDPEIVGIFVEEATEVLTTIDSQLPQWQAQPGPGSALTELRRAFHTLKGSGRMVGAGQLGELAWSVEKLLNRVLDGALAPSLAVVDAVVDARELLPGLVEVFSAGGEPDRHAVESLCTRLDALARGEEVPMVAAVQAVPSQSPQAAPAAADHGVGERLLTIFVEELSEHLHALHAYLEAPERGAVTQSLLRTLHTLHGSSSAAGNDSLTLVLEPLDDMVHGVGEAGGVLTVSQLALLSRLCELLEYAQSDSVDGAMLHSRAQALHVQIEELYPQAGHLAHPDARLVRFLHEALEGFDRGVSLLAEWRTAHDGSAVGRAFLAELRAVHEAAARLGVDGVLRLSQPLLDVLAPALEARRLQQPPVELFTLLGEACEAGLDVLDRLAASELPDVPTALIERLQALDVLVAPASVDVQPETDDDPEAIRERIRTDLVQADPELLDIFLEEAEELMTSIDEALDSWRRTRDDRESFDDLQRHLHTLKGGARMAGLACLGELSHDFEALLINGTQRFGSFDDTFLSGVADFHTRLLSAMAVIRSHRLVAEPRQEVAPTEEMQAVLSPQAALTEAVAPVAKKAAAKPRGEVVRVSAQLLEELVNLAGETSISRARVEEQVSELGQLFDDMQGAIERVQGQVRQLDIATEAQVLFRRERADGSFAEGFDPLEMDRYSQLQQLSRSLVESSSDLLDIKRTLAEKARDLETVLIQQARINGQLQEGLMRSRMVPFLSVVPRLKRLVRQVAGELGKEAELVMGSVEGNLDRGILERVVAPLEHMLRNAVDHGIEARILRLERGKPACGQIRIDIVRDGGDVLIIVADDGAGIDLGAVRDKAIERGLLAPEARLREHDVLQFILHPGFSTAATVTQISGRGVGMDVVSSEIRQMGGALEIDSRHGEGTRFVVRLPFTVSVNRALLVGVGQETYALPLNTVAGVVRMRADELARHLREGLAFEYAGQDYRIRHLGTVLYPDEQRELDTGIDTVSLVLVRGGGQTLAVEVDRLLGARDIAVKSLGPQFGAVPGLSGATVLGDGSVVLILDLPAMLRVDAACAPVPSERVERPKSLRPVERPPLIMVVDDSVTVRKVTSRFLEREGMQVLSAKDGAEAMLKLQEQQPDVMLLDIEMPHMDGFEVISKVRLSATLRELPIIMITSRTGDKHRERAFALGANAYLGKPYQESVLLEQIRTLLPRREVEA